MVEFPRLCVKHGCGSPAVATLTYSYEDATVVLGHLSPRPVPGCFDFCLDHARHFKPVRGWQLLVLDESFRIQEQGLPQQQPEDSGNPEAVDKPEAVAEPEAVTAPEGASKPKASERSAPSELEAEAGPGRLVERGRRVGRFTVYDGGAEASSSR